MQELEEFRQDMLARSRARAEADSNFLHSAFAEVAAEMLEEAEEVLDFQPCYYRGKGSRNRNLAVDGYAFDDADGSMRLVVTDFSGGATAQVLTRTDAKVLFAGLVAFAEDALKGAVERNTDESSPEHGLARELRTRGAAVTRYRCYLVTDHVLSEKVKDWPEGEIGGVPADFHIWDAARFLRAQQSRSGRDELVVDFTEFVPGGLPCLPAGVDAGTYEGYLCVIPGAVLADIYDRYGSRLLEGNVRAFLSTSGGVNRGIQQTVQKEPQMFFAFNNGISATASAAALAHGQGGSRILSATEFQIVNGGQTTASLSHARRRGGYALDGVYVQVKLSVVGEEESGNLIPLISRFSNSQNKVSDADFFSNHEFHRQVEKMSRRLRAPAKRGSQVETFWFYERARGQYAVELGRVTGAKRRQFELENPRDQLVTKTDLAKVENSWRCLPHEVSRGAQKNFLRFAETVTKDWELGAERFNDEYFRGAIAKLVIFRALEKLVPKEPWYNGGYRANIVAYSLAKLADMAGTAERGRHLNLDLVWRQQSLPTALEEQLRLIAAAAYTTLTSPETGIQNITEWAKKELCWKRLKEAQVKWLPAMSELLVDAEELASRNRAAKADAKVDAAVSDMAEVLAFGAERWAKLRSSAASAGLLTGEDERLLRVATNPRWVASDRQARELVKLRSRLFREGLAAD